MKNSILDKISATRNNLLHDLNCSPLWNLFIFKIMNILSKIATVTPFHDNINKIVSIINIVALNNIGMIKGRMKIDLIFNKFNLVMIKSFFINYFNGINF